jgi:hypothetical protein
VTSPSTPSDRTPTLTHGRGCSSSSTVLPRRERPGSPLRTLEPGGETRIVTLPSTIAKLKAVKHLELYGSHLVRIPPEIGDVEPEGRPELEVDVQDARAHPAVAQLRAPGSTSTPTNHTACTGFPRRFSSRPIGNGIRALLQCVRPPAWRIASSPRLDFPSGGNRRSSSPRECVFRGVHPEPSDATRGIRAGATPRRP